MKEPSKAGRYEVIRIVRKDRIWLKVDEAVNHSEKNHFPLYMEAFGAYKNS